MDLRSVIRLPRRREPDVAALQKRDDVDGLVTAAAFQKPRYAPDGRYFDGGTHVRVQAILALGQLGLDAGNGTIAAALRDPFDSVRCAAVGVLHARGEALELANAMSWLPPGRSLQLAAQAIVDLRTTPVVR